MVEDTEESGAVRSRLGKDEEVLRLVLVQFRVCKDEKRSRRAPVYLITFLNGGV